MMADDLDKQFAEYLARDDEALMACQFFEILAEIERRRAQEPIEVTLRVVNGQAQFEPSDRARTEGNTVWVGDRRLVVTVAADAHTDP